MVASRDDGEHPSVTVLTLKARVNEDGTHRVLDETVVRANWTEAPGMDQWERHARERARTAVEPRIQLAQAKHALGEVIHLEAESRSGGVIWQQAVDDLRHEALQTLGLVGVPLRRSHSTRPVLLYGQWTVDLAFSGSDHQAVRDAFSTEVPLAAAEWAAHPEWFPRVEIPKNGRVAGTSKDTPEAVRRAAQRPRAIPRPSRTPFANASWVMWTDPRTGQPRRGVVSGGAVYPDDGGEALLLIRKGRNTGEVSLDATAMVPLTPTLPPA